MASTVQQSEMSVGEVVLGLLIERPDTCYQLDKRIAERLGSAQFSRGAASRAVERLVERELVRPAQVAQAAGLRAVEGRRRTVYEATPAGMAHFERWLHASTQTPPVREELHAKIALWGAAELPRLIEIVREAELACVRQLQDLNRGTQSERGLVGVQEWERTMQLIVVSGEAMWWEARIRWLQEVRAYLEREHARRGSQPGLRAVGTPAGR
jgi:DNA-binding PadR family transcriptional regulator